MIENLLNQTFVYDEIQELEDKNKYLLEKIERFKKGIKIFLEDLYQLNHELKLKNDWIGQLLKLENLLLEDYNKYENIENLLNQTFVYDKIQELEDKNKYLLEKIERFKKGIKDLLKNWKQTNYNLEMKNQLIQIFEQLENLLPLSSIENLKQENHQLNQNLILKEKELEDFKIDNKNYEQKILDLNQEKQNLTEQLNKVNQETEILSKENKDLTDELTLSQQQLNKVTKTQRETQSKLDTVTKEKQNLTDTLEESLLIKNSDYYQKLKYISEPIIISKHKDNNWNIETLPNIKDEKIEKTILLNIEENKILNNLIEQKNNITIIFCKKTKKFKEAFFIDKYQNKIIINIENEQQKILEKLNYKIRTEMASSLTQSDINKINNFNNQKEPKKSPCLTKEELKRYQNQGAVPKHYKLV